MTEQRAANKAGRSLARAIAWGGLLAGTIDIGAAALINLLSPLVILRAVAAGVLGNASFQDGMAAAALGMVLQWAMSLLIAAIFVVATTRLRWLVQRPITAGLAYGAAIFFVMNYVVMPLSAIGRSPHFTPLSFVLNLLAMLLFGLIVAVVARRKL